MSYEAINFRKKFALFDEQWQPKVIAEMNDYQFKVVKLAKIHGTSSRLMCERMTGSKSSGHPICAARSLELRPAAYFRGIANLSVRN